MMKPLKLCVTSLRLDEEQAQYFVSRAMDVVDRNVVGPQQYAALYVNYAADLLTSKAEREADSFLQEPRTMDEMKTVRFYQKKP